MRQMSYECQSSPSDTVYPYVLFPEDGTRPYPFRHSRLRTPMPVLRLASMLRTSIGNAPLEIIEDACFKFADGGCTYPVQLAIVSRGSAAFAMAVIIDEPYTISDHAPRHYIEDAASTHLDVLLRRAGWIVARFAEKQAVEEPAACLNTIITAINERGAVPHIAALNAHSAPAPFRRFSKLSASLAAKSCIREGYLHREGFEPYDIPAYSDSSDLTQEERDCMRLLDIASASSSEDDNLIKYNNEHHFKQDDLVSFTPETHTYLYRRIDSLKSATSMISEYFEVFDADSAATRMAEKSGRNRDDIINEWSLTALKASETGTHMHAQIERTMLGLPTNSSRHLKFNVRNLKCDEYVDISKELGFFHDFFKAAGIKPYRTEWHIYDTAAHVAGSPDLVAEKNGKLIMFDWKRSTKVVDPSCSSAWKGKPNLNCWGHYGKGKLSKLPDCSFIHYSLQQGVYKHILKKNYDIDIAGTFLIVLHPAYSTFYCVPTLDVEPYAEYLLSVSK